MLRSYCVGCLALAGLLGAAVPTRADLFLRVPFVNLHLGQPAIPASPAVCIQVPFFGLTIHRAAVLASAPLPGVDVSQPVPVQRPEEIAPPRVVPIEPQVVPAPPVAVLRPIAPEDFAASFRPAAGSYQVTFLHPNGCPVDVCFTLPDGCPKVHAHKRSLVFDYGKHEVRIRFQIGGKVKVSYD